MIAEDYRVKTSISEIQQLSKIVYDNPTAVSEKIGEQNGDVAFLKNFSKKFNKNPKFVANFAGSCYFFMKDQRRKDAEKCLPFLKKKIEQHARIVEHIREQIIQKQEQEKERVKRPVEVPDRDLKNLISLSQKKQMERLSKSSRLRLELRDYMGEINQRLSFSERQAIARGDHEYISKSFGVSPKQAKKIVKIVTLTKEAHRRSQDVTINLAKQAILNSRKFQTNEPMNENIIIHHI
ncbi:BID domain-containing T4SS effector [Bartonella ancashensis]|nr:BID domain-containing T4SS effector [Bartonella ancashensis]ALE03030.1 hypothetical protein PU02_0216 [Bartonella ancashensis]